MHAGICVESIVVTYMEDTKTATRLPTTDATHLPGTSGKPRFLGILLFTLGAVKTIG